MKIQFANARSFADTLNKFAEKTGMQPAIVAKRVAFEIFTGVVSKTPVDTGWARASWKITEGTVDLTVPPKPERGTVLPAPADPAVESRNPFPTWYVTNNLPYIGELEAGRSQQAEKGFMVQRTLAEIESNINILLRGLS